jgi:transmembrane sensor
MKDLELLKFLKKELSGEEKTAVLKWIEESEGNRRRYIELKNLWALSALVPDMNDTVAPSNFEFKVPLRSSRSKILIISLIKYAAVVIVTFGLSFYLSHVDFIRSDKKETGYHTISAPLGQATDIILADGSEVTLNSGTELTYSVNYSKKNRRVSLTGEAFFRVRSDIHSPFTVTASGIDIVATGTSFNVDAYTEDRQVNVTLVEGSVNLYSQAGKDLLTLCPGENVRIDIISREMKVTRVDTRFYTSWQQGMITFSNRRLEDIVRDLERWYSVEIIFSNDECKEIRYSGTILKHKPVDQVLEILQLTSDFRFDIEVIDNRLSRIIIKE